jgi:hypothetical protein
MSSMLMGKRSSGLNRLLNFMRITDKPKQIAEAEKLVEEHLT